MSYTSEIAALQGEIYASIATRLAQQGIPSDVGKVVMDGVYSLFIQSAYNGQAVQLGRLATEVEQLQKEVNELKKAAETTEKTTEKTTKKGKDPEGAT